MALRTFEQTPAEEVLAMLKNPKNYDLKWGEYMHLMYRVSEIAEKANPKPAPTVAKDEYLRKKVNKLEKRVEELENKLSKARITFEEEIDWDDDLEYEDD